MRVCVDSYSSSTWTEAKPDADVNGPDKFSVKKIRRIELEITFNNVSRVKVEGTILAKQGGFHTLAGG